MSSVVTEQITRESTTHLRAHVPRARVQVKTKPYLMIATLVGVDLAAVASAMLIAIYGRWLFGAPYPLSMYFRLWPCLGVFIAAFVGAQLYPAVPLAPAEELRRMTKVITLVFLGLGTATFFSREPGMLYSRSVLVISWFLCVVFVWCGRGLTRMLLARLAWWGHPVVVLGSGETADQVVRALKAQPGIGLKPVAVISQSSNDDHGELLGVPVISGLHRCRGLAREHGVSYAILAMPDLEARQLEPLLKKLSRAFHHLIYVPRLVGFSSLWVTAVDMGGTLGLEVRHRLLDPGRQALKRVLDLAMIVLAMPLLVPVMGLIALAVKLDSPGPVFYASPRIGKRGQQFRMWKFRTMVHDAPQVLEEALAADPALREEWEAEHKLRNDPRITRAGRWLRKTSLDELPQVWNVVKGEMSLVGPRPMLCDGALKYGDAYLLYTKVCPGITGLWQVSGRNNLSYVDRVRLDAYYVRNWSVWLDLYLLGRNTLVVIRGEGAY